MGSANRTAAVFTVTSQESPTWYSLQVHAQTAEEFHHCRVILGHNRART